MSFGAEANARLKDIFTGMLEKRVAEGAVPAAERPARLAAIEAASAKSLAQQPAPPPQPKPSPPTEYECFAPPGMAGGHVPRSACNERTFITLSFADAAVSDPKGKVFGKANNNKVGFSRADLERIQTELRTRGVDTKLISLREECDKQAKLPPECAATPDAMDDACILFFPDWARDALYDEFGLDAEEHLYEELLAKAKWDMKAPAKLKRSEAAAMADDDPRLVWDKRARARTAFVPGRTFDPTYKDMFNGEGTVNDENAFPHLKWLRDAWNKVGAHQSVVSSANLYIDSARCGIKPHGDGEREYNAVVWLGPGAEGCDLIFTRYYRGVPYGQFRLSKWWGCAMLFGGKALGHDFKRSSVVTYRHATGADEYTKLNDTPAERQEKKRKRDAKDAEDGAVRTRCDYCDKMFRCFGTLGLKAVCNQCYKANEVDGKFVPPAAGPTARALREPWVAA